MIDTAKAVIVTLSVDIPESEQGKDATVTVGANTYAGKLTTIIVYTPPAGVPAMTKVTLSAPGLQTA